MNRAIILRHAVGASAILSQENMIMTPLLFTAMVPATLGVSFLPPYISLAADATATERYAASELHEQLAKACPGVNFTIGKPLPLTAQIVVGPGAAAALGVSLPSNLEGNESYVIDTTGEMVQASVVLAGGIGSARGTLYAAYQLLELLGWRFYAADETRVPALCPATSLVPPHKNVDHLPFEYRDNNQWAPAHNLTFAVRSGYNGHAPADRGDAVAYATPPGFVHTSYALLYYPEKSSNVPPPDLFAKHPEWFWPKASQGGATAYGQLCWSNSSLIKYLTAQVRAILAAEPDSMILSVSQNDNYNRCRTDAEERINDAEGSPMGALLRAVNTIADAVKDDWPHVAIDTLAYQWSRPATKLTRPRPNVIVRLCTIECDFGRPLTHPHNAPFQRDMEAWARISNRTWIWNYVTNFQNYYSPFPDWWVLTENIRYFHEHGVTGIFEEGTYTSPGGDLSELKDYVMAAAMRNVSIDGPAAIREFVEAYYGPDGAWAIMLYMQMMHGAILSSGYYMPFSFEVTAPFLTPAVLLEAARVLAEGYARAEGRYAPRLAKASLPVCYVSMRRWSKLRAFATQHNLTWPLHSTLKAEFAWFAGTFNASGATYLDEWGHDLDWLREQLFGGSKAAAVKMHGPRDCSKARHGLWHECA